MTYHIPYYHLTYRKRFLYLLLVSTLTCFFIGNLGLQLFSRRAYNHFLFSLKQPLRYIEQWRSGYQVQNILDCVLSKTDKTFSYEDISHINVPEDSIFFIETSCRHSRGVELSARQACSVESAAKMNPARQVFVLIVSSVRNRTQSPVIETLLEYRNIKLVQYKTGSPFMPTVSHYANKRCTHVDPAANGKYCVTSRPSGGRHITVWVDLDLYFEKTPLEKFFNDDTVLTSFWPLAHMSDVLRYVTLYKYGGTYLDLDFVVIQSLSSLQNYAGAESGIAVAAGVIHLTRGHWLAGAALRELRDNFFTTEWGANGPGILTRLMRRECRNASYAYHATTCSNFTIYPPPYFYPVHWTDWRNYFNTTHAHEVMQTLHSSYAAHVWNSFAKHLPVHLKSDEPYAQLAREFCPKMSRLANDSF